ncbi:acetylcholinesterase precursor [Boeremia exigua]|uniref:acetylcholinesterase precursor n=1 Tax=Boeremia exigua TaxID=749465 RepID=UPI001E8E1F16|nr:acetylcholinesterase precursor [Boeremia exigua]KAH6625111.1 acetylcholinesterase precursor [Boeremia exigua]
MHLQWLPALLVALSSTGTAFPNSQPFKEALRATRSSGNESLEVDLGYGIYQGSTNTTTRINTWRGIRYAAPPIGTRRWQRPEPPAIDRSATIQADRYGPICYQSPFSGAPNFGAITAEISEDCLFLNVQGPANATKLPVLVWIHGGGYGVGNGQTDFTDLITVNDNRFIVVSIQYRLGAFGFLASDELVRNGVANAGLLDQNFALQWVQEYISNFGGDPSSVTISGVSAGGGSVMLQDMAYGGSLGESLFRSSIAASPYLPKQYAFNHWVPTQSYYAFAEAAGCPVGAYRSANETIFDCLVSRDTATLSNASAEVSTTGTFGTWGFLPVTDGVFVQDVPSRQLLDKRLNGRSLLVGNNANEGPLFTPQNITSESDFLEWLGNVLPELQEDDIAKVLDYYPSISSVDRSSSDLFATSGYAEPSALGQSSIATGPQQRANNLYAELTFVCPSYWMAEAYSGQGHTAFKYQFSPLPGTHGADQEGYLGPLGRSLILSADFQRAFMTMWGNFITHQDPSISNELAVGALSNEPVQANPASTWPMFSNASPYQLNLNQTGGIEAVGGLEVGSLTPTSYLTGPGLRNNFTLANAYTWEAGRGIRCDFWRGVAPIIPA